MSILRNNVKLLGNVGADPEVSTLDNNRKLAKFSIAINESYKNQSGEIVKNTSWFNLIAWGKTADLIEKYVIKGSEISVSGKLSNNSYEDKEGIKRYSTQVIVDEFLIISGGKGREEENSN